MDVTERQQKVHEKGFDMLKAPTSSLDTYARLKIGSKQYNDALIDLHYYDKKNERGFRNKEFVLAALAQNDLPTLREISKYFYRTNGIYQKVINTFATMYRYDWYVATEDVTESANSDNVVKDCLKVLSVFDNSDIKSLCGEFALSVIRDGVYYGYAYQGEDCILIQELPIKWCRSRFRVKNKPAIEFNMQYFDTKYPDAAYRLKVLELFPPEFKEGYILYKQHKLPPDGTISNPTVSWGSWYLLDPAAAFKFAIRGLNEMPLFISAIPDLLDLELVQGIDRKRQLQQLLKIIVQLLPLDKNGDLIFDVDEAKDIHNNAVEMLANSVGVDVLTTFADVKAIEVSDANKTTTDNSLENAERTVYNSLGVSKNLFNTDGNLSLEKSILADEGTLRDLLLQFEALYNYFARSMSASAKKWKFRFYFLQTTQYNYQALSKLYKEQTAMGFSKMLPQIALGQSQSFILNSILFENNILNLSEIMIPPLMSSTLNAEDVKNLGSGKQTSTSKTQESVGRPKKEESDLAEKTIKNQESKS